MNEEYVLEELTNAWTQFTPEVPLSGRKFYLTRSHWEKLGKPLTILIAVEGLEPSDS